MLGERTIYPEMYVRGSIERKYIRAGEIRARPVPVSFVKKIYGMNEEDEYKWDNFNSYEVIGTIGIGGFSIIYEVKKGGKKYAMKAPKGSGSEGRRNPLFQKRGRDTGRKR